MGTRLHELSPGTSTVEMKGPNQQYAFVAGKHSEYAFVAGGTGITPVVQAVGHILQHDTATVRLVTLNKTTGDILLRRELNALQAAFPGRLEITHVVEHGTPGMLAVHGTEHGFSTTCLQQGKASKALLEACLPAPGAGVMVMVCGRPPMTAAIAGKKNKDFTQGEVGGWLQELGFTKDQVWKI
jgi:cytochrome-b5 reductase